MPRDKLIESPEALKTLFQEYKAWTTENPYLWHDFAGKDATSVLKKRQRPLTWIGFEGWLAMNDIVVHLGHYEQNTNNSYTEYLPVIRAIKKECSFDIISGAMAGVYNQNIAARLEGLADKKEVDKKVTKLDFKNAG